MYKDMVRLLDESAGFPEDSFYFFNMADETAGGCPTFGGIWFSDCGDDVGWYFDRYEISERTAFVGGCDGALWTVEYDDDGNITDDCYKTLEEAYFETVHHPGDFEIDQSIFDELLGFEFITDEFQQSLKRTSHLKEMLIHEEHYRVQQVCALSYQLAGIVDRINPIQ